MGEPTMEEYMTKTREDYESGIVRPKINEKVQFELKGQFLKELRDNTFSGSDNEDANEHIEKMAGHSQKWYNGTSTRTRSTDTSDGKTTIKAQLNKIGREIKKEDVKVFEEAFYTQYGVPFPSGGRFRAVALGFYQRDNENPSYQERRKTMEESMNKFMAESAKRHDKNSILIKEIHSSTNVAIRNQGASIKALEIQIE
ncbi:hypothetical protein Tco_1511451 [Tanacetum coccineum]